MVDDLDVTAGGKGQEWVSRLFQLLGAYESNPAAFDGDGFMELYAKVERAIELSGESESQAFSLDQSLFNAVSIADVDTSDLRFVVCHGLTIHHRYHADYGRGFEQAYRWCEKSRGQQLPDLKFIHAFMLPKILQKGSMGGNLDVSLFLLERLGRFENLEKAPVWEDENALELLKQEPGEIIYQLARRRVKYIAENLTKVPNSLEQRLNKDGAFRQLYKDHLETVPLLSHQIQVYEYTRGDPFWRRVGQAIVGMFRGLVQRMAGEYIAYEMTKRNGAFIVQSLLIVLILLGLAMGLYGWVLRSNARLSEIETDLAVARDFIDRDQEMYASRVDSLENVLGRW